MKRSKAVRAIVCILILCGLLGVCQRHRARSAVYEEACALMEQERWSEASLLLEPYDVFADLYNYCEARSRLKDGDTIGARFALDRIYPLFRKDEVAQLRQEIEADMPAYRERERQKEEQRLQEEKAEARRGVPYVGMDEDWIDITSLGVHDGLRYNNEVKNGTVCKANLYDFENSDGAVIFTARCLSGEVTQVWDYRDDPRKQNSYTPVYDPDPFDAKDYIHPDDFYYDHYDDFWDYEDAEDYYYEHCD